MRKLNLKLRTLISLIFLSLTLIISFVSLYAWFSNNREVENNGLDMQIDADSINAMPMTAYWKYFQDEKPLYEKSTKGKISLPTYDSVFEELNENCEIFIRVPVFGRTVTSGEDFTVSFSISDMDKNKGYIGSDTNNNHYEYDEEKGEYSNTVALYLSNVVSVTCGIIPSLNETSDMTDDGVVEIVEKTKEYFKTSGEQKEFLNNETKEKSGTVQFLIHDYENDRLDISEDDEDIYVLYLYFRITYDAELIENLMEHHELSLGGQTYDISSDFDKIILDIKD